MNKTVWFEVFMATKLINLIKPLGL